MEPSEIATQLETEYKYNTVTQIDTANVLKLRRIFVGSDGDDNGQDFPRELIDTMETYLGMLGRLPDSLFDVSDTFVRLFAAALHGAISMGITNYVLFDAVQIQFLRDDKDRVDPCNFPSDHQGFAVKKTDFLTLLLRDRIRLLNNSKLDPDTEEWSTTLAALIHEQRAMFWHLCAPLLGVYPYAAFWNENPQLLTVGELTFRTLRDYHVIPPAKKQTSDIVSFFPRAPVRSDDLTKLRTAPRLDPLIGIACDVYVDLLRRYNNITRVPEDDTPRRRHGGGGGSEWEPDDLFLQSKRYCFVRGMSELSLPLRGVLGLFRQMAQQIYDDLQPVLKGEAGMITKGPLAYVIKHHLDLAYDAYSLRVADLCNLLRDVLNSDQRLSQALEQLNNMTAKMRKKLKLGSQDLYLAETKYTVELPYSGRLTTFAADFYTRSYALAVFMTNYLPWDYIKLAESQWHLRALFERDALQRLTEQSIAIFAEDVREKKTNIARMGLRPDRVNPVVNTIVQLRELPQ